MPHTRDSVRERVDALVNAGTLGERIDALVALVRRVRYVPGVSALR